MSVRTSLGFRVLYAIDMKTGGIERAGEVDGVGNAVEEEDVDENEETRELKGFDLAEVSTGYEVSGVKRKKVPGSDVCYTRYILKIIGMIGPKDYTF